jgi:hypothetical protein
MPDEPNTIALGLRPPPILLRIVLVLVPVVCAAIIAGTTIFDAHPDEKAHVDAFRYFENHWSRPPLGSPELVYSPMGWSRVFTGEIVYPLYGKLACVVHRFAGVEPFRLYRYLNVALLALTLGLLMFLHCRWCDLWLLALVMIAIPQVIYVYAYANSDAWGTSCAVLLLAQAAVLIDSPPLSWRWLRLALLMLNVLFLILSKVGFVLGILMPAILIARTLFLHRRALPWRWIAGRIALPLLAVALLASLYDPELSPHRRQWKQQVLAMREQVALPGFKPSNPTHPGLYLSSRGGTYTTVIHTGWFWHISDTFYSRFGGWQVHHPLWVFIAAATIGLAALALTVSSIILFRRRLSAEFLICFCIAPPIIALNIYGALCHALHIDCQAQGRYLFPSLAAVFFITFAVPRAQPPALRRVHLAILWIAVALSIFSLVRFGILDPTMRKIPFWYGFT